LNDITDSIEENRNLIDNIKSHIKIMAKDVIRLPKEIKEDYADDIVLLNEMYNKHLIEQKRENIRLQREVSGFQKENIDLQNEIYYLLGRLNTLEKEVGLKAKGYTYNEENLINDGEVLYIIKTEDI
jgi:HSP20 family molecular chaperone IbpA